VLDAGFISVGHVQYDASHSLECTALQWLREEVCKHVRFRAEGYFDLTFFILSVTKKYRTLMCRVLFELEDFPFSASRIILLLSWYIVVVGT